MSEEQLNVSEGLDQLEEIVETLESDSLDLDESMNLFKQGVELAEELENRLDKAEQELKTVVKDSEGSFTVEDFEI